jgi:hypothetical protein
MRKKLRSAELIFTKFDIGDLCEMWDLRFLQEDGKDSSLLGCYDVLVGKYIHTQTHTHMYSSWIHKFVTKTVGCGRSYKYTNIHSFYNLEYYLHFKKRYYKLFLHIKKY